jgi:hypothetical protein
MIKPIFIITNSYVVKTKIHNSEDLYLSHSMRRNAGFSSKRGGIS